MELISVSEFSPELIKEAPTKLLAPNGKPSKLTPEQYEVVRTPEFNKWFGDWENAPKNASKIVDENGEPLAINRVRGLGGIRKRMGREDKSAKGIYSSSIPMGEVKDIFDPENKGRYFTGFANVRNPLVMERTYYFDKRTKKPVEWSFDLKPEDYIEMKVISPQDFKLLKDLGYDGVWANKNDLPGVMIDEIIVFEKNQLKVEEVKDVDAIPKFRKEKPAESEPLETVDAVVEEMRNVELINKGVEVGKPKTTDKKIDVKALNKRVAKPYDVVKWEDFKDLPFTFTITDALTTGNVQVKL